ncbi:MAG: DUF2269 family protein [Acidimicrobiales bacterium]
MIATSVGYDLVFLVHVMTAVAVVIVLVAMRFAADAVARGADPATQARRLPAGRNWAARLVHLLPVTGLVMALSGGPSVSLDHAWVVVGIVLYVLAAGHLEARTLPLEAEVAREAAREGRAPAGEGRRLRLSIDTALALIALALLAMLVQF